MREEPAASGKEPKPQPDFAKMFDLDRSSLIKSFVDRIEQCLREAKAARDDLKEIIAEASEAEFPVRDVQAMKTIAKLRLDDKKGAAQEKLEAMERVGRAVGFDLFDFAAARIGTPHA